MNTATSVPRGENTSAASCWMSGSQPALWPDGEGDCRSHEPGIAAWISSHSATRASRAVMPWRSAGPWPARGQRERDEQRAEIVRCRVLAARECGLVDDRRRRAAAGAEAPCRVRVLAGLEQVAAARERARSRRARSPRVDRRRRRRRAGAARWRRCWRSRGRARARASRRTSARGRRRRARARRAGSRA